MMAVMVNEVPIACINHAAVVSHVPANVILSVLKAEGGKNSLALRNRNGTFDYSVFQINSIWLPVIARYGYTRDDMQFNPCKNVAVATWIMAQGIASGKSLWAGVANFHSRTPAHNLSYKKSIYKNYTKLVDVISA